MTRKRSQACWRTAGLVLPVMMAVPSAHAQLPPAPSPPTAISPARREPTAGDLATARTALREGLALRDKGAVAEALPRLASAYDLVPTPVTGFELGKTHMMLGHTLHAHELFKKVLRMPPSMEESTRPQERRGPRTTRAQGASPLAFSCAARPRSAERSALCSETAAPAARRAIDLCRRGRPGRCA
ncbi:MAG TPA: hypothetical protein VM580_19770, partial [Labilithrix sp.]|nr:hypothetical protein [Labilithrix sp.]